jgi:hypothetical protein
VTVRESILFYERKRFAFENSIRFSLSNHPASAGKERNMKKLNPKNTVENTQYNEDKLTREFLLSYLDTYEQEKFEAQINTMFAIDDWDIFT